MDQLETKDLQIYKFQIINNNLIEWCMVKQYLLKILKIHRKKIIKLLILFKYRDLHLPGSLDYLGAAANIFNNGINSVIPNSVQNATTIRNHGNNSVTHAL